MVIQGIKECQENEAQIAALSVVALGEKYRLQGQGFSVEESRAQLLAAAQSHKAWAERNAASLQQHGEEIRKHGLAGSEFIRV